MVTSRIDCKELSDLFIRTGRIQYMVMALILSGFIVFGNDFICLWAGPEYKEAYLIGLLFFVSLTIPMIQNLGITILQARNQMKFRSLLYLGIAVLSLVFQFVLARKYGGIGCAVAISAALLLGQGLIMNIYYHYKQSLDMVKFWKEIAKMSWIPAMMCISALMIFSWISLDNWISLGIAILLFITIYIPLFYLFGMNNSERNLLLNPFLQMKARICHD